MDQVYTIVIDAGHGGYDPGALHHHLEEKVLALDIASRLRNVFQDAGMHVVMTREADRFISLNHRAALANRLRADLFISIHLNANNDHLVRGAEVYYPRESIVSPTAPWPSAIHPAEVSVSSSGTVKSILWSMVMMHQRAQGQRLASSICESLGSHLEVGCVTKPARFVVLREAWIPAVLVEVGYISNRVEASHLSQMEYREAAARAIAEGVLGYLQVTQEPDRPS